MRNARLIIVFLAVAAIGAPAGAESLSGQLKSEGAAKLAVAARERGDAVRGAVLFPQQKLGCANCHAVAAKNLLGPDLSKMDRRTTDEYLVEAILEPSKAIKKGFESVVVATTDGKIFSGRVLEESPMLLRLRVVDQKTATSAGAVIRLAKSEIEERSQSPSSVMPESLVDQLASRQQFLDLVRYLMELKRAGADAGNHTSVKAAGRELSQPLRGRILIDKLHCAACHSAASVAGTFASSQAPNLNWAGGRINPDYIERFVADPTAAKPGTTMPDVLGGLDPAERREFAKAITHYIVSLRPESFAPKSLDQSAALRGHQLFNSVGCAACHAPRGEDGGELPAESVVPLGRLDRKYHLDSLVELLKQPHVARPSGRMPNMKLTHWEAADIAHFLLANPQGKNELKPTFELDRTLAAKGKRHFDTLGCVRCHGQADADREQTARTLANARLDHGCLSEESGAWPQFQLSEMQRSDIRAALRHDSGELRDTEKIDLALATFNCIACHRRGDFGGVSGDRDEYFHTTNPNLGPQGRIPPSLTGIGGKLKPKPMRDVLVNGASIRPYMTTRMPQFGVENVVHLIDLFQRVDQLPSVQYPEISDEKEMRNQGVELAGNGGLNCIACHTFRQKPAQTMPAVDLTLLANRLHKDWFHLYMRNPQRFNPGTVMPSFWPGGNAMRKEILNGDTDLQIEALWTYLLDGRQARTPRGLVVEPLELVAAHEAVMLRRSYPGIGKRGIGVGYPSQVNLAFDAEQMRLGMIWKGKFADPGGVWRGQGHGRVRPLGRDPMAFGVGPDLDDEETPWKADGGRPPFHRFGGYTLDDLRRPAFEYQFRDIAVRDYFVDIAADAGEPSRLRRILTFTVKEPRGNIAFRAGSGRVIESVGPEWFEIDGKLKVKVDNRHEARIVETADSNALSIPLRLAPGKTRLILEYQW